MKVELVLLVNGKIVNKIEVPYDLSEAESSTLALDDSKVRSKLGRNNVLRVAVVPNRLVNVITR